MPFVKWAGGTMAGKASHQAQAAHVDDIDMEARAVQGAAQVCQQIGVWRSLHDLIERKTVVVKTVHQAVLIEGPGLDPSQRLGFLDVDLQFQASRLRIPPRSPAWWKRIR